MKCRVLRRVFLCLLALSIAGGTGRAAASGFNPASASRRPARIEPAPSGAGLSPEGKDSGKEAGENSGKDKKKERNLKGLSVFKDKHGTPLLTNRPEKYEGRPDYIEVNIKFEPVVVPSRYRRNHKATGGTRLATIDLREYSVGSIADLVEHYSKKYHLDKNLVFAVIKQESNFNPCAVSPAGARGLMQLMPYTALEMGVTNIFDPAQNIAGGTQYLAKMMELFNNDTKLALAGYNAGPNSVVKCNYKVPSNGETPTYVACVQRYIRDFERAALKPSYLVASAKAPDNAYLPVKKAEKQEAKAPAYTVRFHSGLTQPADKVEEQSPYYAVTFGDRTSLIRKDFVKEVIKGV